MIYHCCDELRREAVRAHATLNGIDYLEVLDHDAPAGSPRQRTLLVRLLKPVPAGFAATQVRIEGGERERNLHVEWVDAASAPPADATAAEQAFVAALDTPDHVLVVRVDRYGDYAPYVLRLVRSALDAAPPVDFDPRLVEITFSFKVECPSDFDCKPVVSCPQEPAPAPDIDYLAKDYASFCRLILDRLTTLIPGWRERTAADLGVTLAELLAYVGDHLSYQQDAVATEAYLETARLRTSLRRHALLVDYRMHDGCNARAWLHVVAGAPTVNLPRAGTRFYTRVPNAPPRFAPGSPQDVEALRALPLVFEPMHAATLHAAHNEMPLYTWGDRRCCLPKKATRATLAGHFPALVPGTVVLFEEMLGPLTGAAGDADPTHRQVVRLTEVSAFSHDDPTAPATDPLNGARVTEIAWAADDGLAFPVCVSAVTDEAHGARLIEGVSVARGNMVLADHGLTLDDPEPLGSVPPATRRLPPDRDVNRCGSQTAIEIPPRFRPGLARGPLTFAGTVTVTTTAGGVRTRARVAFDPAAPAVQATQWDVADALPVITLQSTLAAATQDWTARRDLLQSEPDDPHFVVEVEHDGSTRLRFGDDEHGRRPASGTAFDARYRVGNGRAGNVGADTLVHAVTADSDVAGVRNPLPAVGGTEMEDDAVVRRRAPQAFRRQERAVTPADYAEVTGRHAGVQRAAATLRWTGSWHTVFITVDRIGGVPMDAAFEEHIGGFVDRYRMAGHDTEFDDPRHVSLELDLLVCVKATHFRADVRAGLLEVLGNGVLADGRRGLFHPDNFTFGRTVYLSAVYAAARQVAGVASIQATKFQRQGNDDPRPLADGFMRLGGLEIARLDNDPNFPERGVLRLTLFGGKG